MSNSYYATPGVEMRAALGYILDFTPSYRVLRDTGMMRSTSSSFMRPPGMCKVWTFGAEPVMTPNGV